ncbi:MAG TPA: hybrid-cluster NAD(P)-dependent oxidoreductase [Nocardioidaceae bacterium]|nr:hybrid-cluster NAD(P)-dependent oxidoreductase [Nocardioidaceae bacterium]
MTEMLVRAPAIRATAGSSDQDQWCEEFDETLVCSEVLQITHDVKSLVLRPIRPRRFVFEPGQHLTVHARIDGRQIDRCYTIASSCLQPEALTITVKRVPGGPVSSWLHDHVEPGRQIAVSGPLGEFSTTRYPAEKYLFLSAGSGITPLMSMVRTMRDRGGTSNVVFVHNARTPDDIIFRDELQRMAVGCPGIRTVAICEHDAPSERWTGLRGRMTLPMLQAVAPDLAEREAFTCGPPAYMATVRTILAHAGAHPSRCHEEAFSFAEEAVPGARSSTTEQPPDRHDGFAIEFQRAGRTIECGPDSTLLMAAARAGLTMPSSCGEGICGTCKTMMLSGTVDMHHQGGIRPREIAQNKILLCCSTPQEDVVLDA